MSKISVLIPVYNVEAYLKECLESVIRQTEKDIEIICVEDASTDHSLEILKKYQKKAPRIRLICHKTNQGTCKARKDAVLAAAGEYLMFVDSDDYLALNACEELYRRIRESGADVMQFGTELVAGENISNEMLEWIRNFMEPSTENISGDLLRECFIRHKMNVNLFNKIWRRECCQQAAFYLTDAKLITAEDWYTCFLFLYHMNLYTGTKNRYYYYRLGTGVTGGDILDLKRFEKRCGGISVADKVKIFLDSKQIYEQYEDVYKRFCTDILWDCTDCWYRKLTNEDQPKGFEILQQHWSIEEIVGSLARTFFEEQEEIEYRMQKQQTKKLAVYYRHIGYQPMDRIIKKYINYYSSGNYEIFLLTDTDALETGEQYMGYQLIHIPAATDANWDRYEQRGTALSRVITGTDQLLYLSPTSHVMILDRVITESKGIIFQAVMDEYVLDHVNKKENELQTVKLECEMKINELNNFSQKLKDYEMKISELNNFNQKLKGEIKHIYETRCGKIMKAIQRVGGYLQNML